MCSSDLAAIGAYVDASPGTVKQAPRELAELLWDRRFVRLQRHLRQLYDDPLRPGQPWQVLRDADQRILGVYSPAAAEPFLRQPPAHGYVQAWSQGSGYARWVFVARPFTLIAQ